MSGQRYPNADSRTYRMVSVIAKVLEQICLASSTQISAEQSCAEFTDLMFFSVRKPSISLCNYIHSLLRDILSVSPSCLAYAVAILDNVQKKNKGLSICELNVNRLFVVALIVSLKCLEDNPVVPYSKLAVSGGFTRSELFKLEVRLLQVLDWKCFVSPEQFNQYQTLLNLRADSIALDCKPLSLSDNIREAIDTENRIVRSQT